MAKIGLSGSRGGLIASIAVIFVTALVVYLPIGSSAPVWVGGWLTVVICLFAMILIRNAKEAHPARLTVALFTVIAISSIIALFARLYMHFGFRDTFVRVCEKNCENANVPRDAQTSIFALKDFLEAMYLSTVTWTTLGYGDVIPSPGWSRAIAGIEAVVAYLTMGLLVAVIFKMLEEI